MKSLNNILNTVLVIYIYISNSYVIFIFFHRNLSVISIFFLSHIYLWLRFGIHSQRRTVIMTLNALIEASECVYWGGNEIVNLTRITTVNIIVR